VTKAAIRTLFLGFCSLLASLSSLAVVVSSPDYATLQTAVQSGGYIRLDFDGTIIFPAALSLSKDVELDGSDHTITFDGASIYGETNSAVQIQASVIGPHATSSVYGAITDLDFNVSADATAQFSAPSSLNNTDPLFTFPDANTAPLLELQPSSPALNRVPMQLVSTDARGFPRPSTGSDSGAIEMEAPFPAVATISADHAIEIRLGLFSHPLKVEATADFLSWRNVGQTGSDRFGEQIFHPSGTDPTTFYRFQTQ